MSTRNTALLFAVGIVCVVMHTGTFGSGIPDAYRQDVSKWPPFVVDESVETRELGRLPVVPPVEWHTPESEALGKMLFFDPRMSGSGQFACASCHDPSLGWTDGRRFSFGHNRTMGQRNAMTLLNVAFFEKLFWDGRADGLLDLMLKPIQSPVEMNANLDTVIEQLSAQDEYLALFEACFGSRTITSDHVAKALASFVRTLVSSPSHFDRFVGGEYAILDDQQLEGLHLFRTRARCMNCHNGPLFSDGEFHHTGLSYFGRRFEDLGQFNATGNDSDRGKFKTPSLRDLQHTGPWMHNGLFTNFTGILRMYNHGITFNSRVQKRPGAPPLSPLIRPLGMSDQEIAALEAFLHTLARIPRFIEPPALPGSDTLMQPAASRSSSSNTINQFTGVNQ